MAMLYTRLILTVGALLVDICHKHVVTAQNYQLTSSCGGSVQAGGSCTLMCYTGEASHTTIGWQNGTTSYRVSQGSCRNPSLPADYITSCPSATNYTLTINNAVYGRDTLSWRCDFQFGGRPSNLLNISVLVPLSNVTITRITTSISCVAVSNPPPSMTLYRDATSVATSPAAVEGYTGWTATINYQLTGNMRNSLYYCQASNTQTSVNSTYSYPDNSAAFFATNRRVLVEGVNFSITCTLDAAITSTVRFYKNTSIQGGCTSTGSCGTSVSGYSVSLDSTSRILTLDITSPDSTRDSGTWRCTAGATVSNNITLSQFAAVLDWSSVTFSPQLTSLLSSVAPQNTISVIVTTPCVAPATVITWRYQQGVSGVPPSSTSSSQGSCPTGQVQTTNSLSLPGNTASLYNRQLSLTVIVEHDSFDPPTYTKSVTSNTIQFPVPVNSVTLKNINSDNEKLGQAVGQPLTLTCVTSASFPTSSVTWVTLPPGTTPTVSTEATSGVLVKTTSSVTFTVRKTDQGRSIHCQAENINGQTSPQSNRATLEGWFGPEQVDVTMPDNSVVFENRNLTLTCTTTAYPNLTFTWDYSDGTPVGGNIGSVSRSSTWWSQTLSFKPYKDKTAVRCQIRNTRTSATQTGSVSLDVKYPPSDPPSITEFETVMFEGDPETISCSVTGGNPLATIMWSCPGTGVASVSDSGQTRTSTLSFTVSRSQNGQQCQCLGAWQYGGYIYILSDVRTFNVSCPTNPQPLNAECNMTGVIAGTTIGTLFLTLLIGGIVMTVFYRKGFRFGNVLSGTTSQKSTRNPEIEEMENIGYSSLDQVNSPAQNSSVDKEASENQHYTQLKIYENTNVEPKGETSTYEEPPVSYESIIASPYQSSTSQPSNPDCRNK